MDLKSIRESNKRLKYVEDGTEQEKEHIKKNLEKLKNELTGAKVDDIVQPEVWQYLSPKMAGQLRRWVNQFIKANQEESEKLAIPFMNKKLRQRIREIDLKLKAQQIKKMIDAKKAEKAKAVSDEN